MTILSDLRKMVEVEAVYVLCSTWQQFHNRMKEKSNTTQHLVIRCTETHKPRTDLHRQYRTSVSILMVATLSVEFNFHVFETLAAG